jgi:outer membrane receptor protein involved in Fe transport
MTSMRPVCPKLTLLIALLAAGPAAGTEDASPPMFDAPAVPARSKRAPSTPTREPGTEGAPPSSDPAAPAQAPAAAGEAPAPDPEALTAATGLTGVCGVLTESSTGEPLIEAEVRVVSGGARSVRTDADGRYALPLPPGEYDVRAYYELHRPRRVGGVVVRQGECTAVDFPLAPDAGAVEEVVVEARADARHEAAVLAERRKAAPVSDAVSAQEISRTPDSSASDAVKRVVSATVVDGRQIVLRGLGGRYSAVLLNGVALPSPDPDEHSVPLDLFPTALLANLTVLKTYTPDLPGGFAGGALQIETTPYPSSRERRVKLTTGADSEVTFQRGLVGDRGALDLLGFDGSVRALPSAVPASGPVLAGTGGLTPADVERIGESFEDSWTARSGTSYPNAGVSATLGDAIELWGRTAGYVATVGYGLKQSARAAEVGKTRNVGNVLEYRELLGSDQAGTSASLSGLVSAGIDLSRDDQLSFIALYSHGGEVRASQVAGYSEGDAQEISTSRLQFVERGLLFGQAKGRHGLPWHEAGLDWQANVSFTRRDEPDTRDTVQYVLPDTLRFKNGPGSGTRLFSELRDVAGGGTVGVTMPLGPPRVGVGVGLQASSRQFDARRFRFVFQGTDPAVLQLPIETMLAPEHIGPDFRLEEETLQSDAYDALRVVYAGYALVDWPVVPRLRVVTGLRYELARQEIDPGTRFAVNPTPEPGTERTDTDVLPAVNVIYAVRPDTNLRAAYSFTLARPQFRELAPFLYFDFARRRSVSGNPDLETTRIHNVDLRWEWFVGQDELLAATAFYKAFRDPIEQAVVSAAQGDLLYVNAPRATAIGAELEGRLSLGRIAPALSRLRAAANVALIHSEVDFGGMPGPQTSDRRAMQGQSPVVANGSLSWAAPFRTEITVLYNVQGRRIAEVGFDQIPDTYERAFHRVDLTAAHEVGERWKLKLGLSNLLDGEVVLEQGDLPVYRYSPGVAGSISLEWS